MNKVVVTGIGFASSIGVGRGDVLASLRDVFRVRDPATPGLYTWWSQRGGARAKNVGWRIDYFCVSGKLIDRARSAAIHSAVTGSDHCPVELILH